MRTPAELFGLMAYLFVMYGGRPDRSLLASVYGGGLDERHAGRPKLSVLPPGIRTAPATPAPRTSGSRAA